MRFLETIKLLEGVPQHLHYHQRRVDTTLNSKHFKLKPLFKAAPPQGCYRVRVLYDGTRHSISYHPYSLEVPKSFALVYDDTITYACKYADRDVLDRIQARRGDAQSVIIVKEGLLSDTPIANIAFLRDGTWFTPDTPLLEGTTRMRLIDSGFLHVTRIKVSDIARFEGFAVMNALTGFMPIEDGIMAIKCEKRSYVN